MRTGYREMLRDRCPSTVDLALKWCKAKTSWVNLVYKHFIKHYTDKQNRYEATRIVLGLNKSVHGGFDFHYTIDWDDLTAEEKDVWQGIESWVNWFTENYLYIENGYIVYRNNGKTKEEIENLLIQTHLKGMDEDNAKKLINYLITHIKNKLYV